MPSPVSFYLKHSGMRFLLTLIPLICLTFPTTSRFPTSIAVQAASPTVWSLVWSDEFDGPNGAAVDSTKWTPEVGGNGWERTSLKLLHQSGPGKRLSDRWLPGHQGNQRAITPGLTTLRAPIPQPD